jgi:uncharacterized protein (DUF1778 family)
LIDRAAELLGKTRIDFMLGASERRAEAVRFDRTIFTVSPEIYVEYLASLDARAQLNEHLNAPCRQKRPGLRRDSHHPRPLADHHALVDFNSGVAELG